MNKGRHGFGVVDKAVSFTEDTATPKTVSQTSAPKGHYKSAPGIARGQAYNQTDKP